MKMTKTIFWNVDTQYDFMKSGGKLPVPDAGEIEGNLEYLTKLAAERGIKVVNTGDYHTVDSKEFSDNPDFETTFPPHCLEFTMGAEFIEETKPENPYIIDWRDPGYDPDKVRGHRNIVLYKDEFDAFHSNGGPHTEAVLQQLNPDRVVVYGVAANVCVNYAILGLLEREVDVVVPTDAIKELPGKSLEEVLEKWKENGACLVKTREVVDYL